MLSLGVHGEASHWCKQLVDGIWNSGEGCGLKTRIWSSFGWRCSQSHGVRGSHGIIKAKRRELGNTSIDRGGKLKRHPRSNRRGKGHTKSTQGTEGGSFQDGGGWRRQELLREGAVRWDRRRPLGSEGVMGPLGGAFSVEWWEQKLRAEAAV